MEAKGRTYSSFHARFDHIHTILRDVGALSNSGTRKQRNYTGNYCPAVVDYCFGRRWCHHRSLPGSGSGGAVAPPQVFRSDNARIILAQLPEGIRHRSAPFLAHDRVTETEPFKKVGQLRATATAARVLSGSEALNHLQRNSTCFPCDTRYCCTARLACHDSF